METYHHYVAEDQYEEIVDVLIHARVAQETDFDVRDYFKADCTNPEFKGKLYIDGESADSLPDVISANN